jgi:hypothetical protein
MRARLLSVSTNKAGNACLCPRTLPQREREKKGYFFAARQLLVEAGHGKAYDEGSSFFPPFRPALQTRVKQRLDRYLEKQLILCTFLGSPGKDHFFRQDFTSLCVVVATPRSRSFALKTLTFFSVLSGFRVDETRTVSNCFYTSGGAKKVEIMNLLSGSSHTCLQKLF